MTGQQWVQEALEEIGVLGEGESVSADDAELCLRKGNLLIDELFLDRQWLHTVNRVTKTLSASTASYTIGSGGSINTVRPTWIDQDAARLVIDTSATTPTETSLEVFTDQRWRGIAQKTLTSTQPNGIYYDHNWSAGLGLIYVWPIPTVSTTQLVLYLPGVAVTAFADLTTDYTMPPGYKSALVFNLAKRLCVPYGAPLTAALNESAMDTLARVKRANTKVTELFGESFSGRSGGWYDIRSNRFR